MTAKASDFDRSELDIATALMTLLWQRGRGTRYTIALLTYAERMVELAATNERQRRRVFQVEPAPQARRVIGQWDSAQTPLYVLRPEDLE